MHSLPPLPSPSDTWPTQLIVLHGVDREDLLGRVHWLLEWLDENPSGDIRALGQALIECVHPNGARLALIAADAEELQRRAERAAQRLADPKCSQIRDVGGIYYTDSPLYQPGAKVAFIYPGEGAQYLGMLGDLMTLPEVRECFEQASRVIVDVNAGARAPLDFVTIPADEGAKSDLEAQLKKLDNAMLTVLVADWALTRVLSNLGVPCDVLAGHSAGELSALMMANAMEEVGALGRLVSSISELENSPGVDATLLAIGASRETIESMLEEMRGDDEVAVELAMDNCPHQTVVVGMSDKIRPFEALVQQRGLVYERLHLARPYHTALFEPLMGPLRDMFSVAEFRPPSLPVYSCTTGELFPNDGEAIRELCISHWRRRVEFVKMIRQMKADDVRIFIEAGPRGNLCSFVDDILRGEQYLAIPSNLPRRHGLTQIQHLAAQLFAQGVPINLEYFWAEGDAGKSAAPRQAMAHEDGAALPSVGLSTAQQLGQQRSLARPSRTDTGHVMQQYLEVMDEFLVTQEQVMTQYLTATPPECSSPSELPLVQAEHDQEMDRSMAGERHSDEHCGVDGESNVGDVAATECHGDTRENVEAEPGPFGPPDGIDPLTRPMIGEMVEYEQRESLVMRRILDLDEDVYADHHTVGGRSISRVDPEQHGLPIMPLTFTVEMMAEVGQALMPELVVRQVRNVQLMRWLAFEKGDPGTIEVSAQRLEANDEDVERDETRVLIQIRNLGTRNKPDEKRLVAAIGTVVLGKTRLEPDCRYQPFDLPGARPCDVTLEQMYNNLFHGELFQGVDCLDRIADEGIEGTIHSLPADRVFRSLDDPAFIGDPILLDIAMHPPAAWHLEEPDQSGRILLPFELERMDFFGRRPPANHPMKSQTRIVETTPRHFAHLTELFDVETGKIWARIHKVKLWRFYFPFHDVNFHGPKDVYFISTEWCEALPADLADHASCSRMDPLDDLKGPALLDAAARVLMSPDEFQRFKRLDRPVDKKPQFLFGRIAAKDAVRFQRRKTNGERLFMADVEIDVNDQGRPIANARQSESTNDYPTISISHCDGLICAMAANHPWVGIDVEPVVPRESSFERIAFSAQERALLDEYSRDQSRDEFVARFWCAKEAVSKALGEGLVEGARSLRIAAVEAEGTLLVSLGPQLGAQFPEFADDLLVAWTRRSDNFVVATSLCWRHCEAAR